MCMKASCSKCRKFYQLSLQIKFECCLSWRASSCWRYPLDGTTWWGCGNHIPGVLDQVPAGKWCTCEPRVQKNGKSYPPMGPKGDYLPQWLSTLLHPPKWEGEEEMCSKIRRKGKNKGWNESCFFFFFSAPEVALFLSLLWRECHLVAFLWMRLLMRLFAVWF